MLRFSAKTWSSLFTRVPADVVLSPEFDKSSLSSMSSDSRQELIDAKDLFASKGIVFAGEIEEKDGKNGKFFSIRREASTGASLSAVRDALANL